MIPANRKIRVMIVEDSYVVRSLLEYLIARDARLEVAASVRTAEQALRSLHRVAPDVISMDIRLPGMDGLEATRRIMAEKPTPIVVVSAGVDSSDLKISINALSAGALAVVEKPPGTTHQDYDRLAERLCTQLTIMSQVKVIRQRFQRMLTDAPAQQRLAPPLADWPEAPAFQMLGLVASTGGPNALQAVLSGLDSFPLPIVIVQHMTNSFLDGFVTWLASVCPLPVQLATGGQIPTAGHVYVAPADRHLTVERGRLHLHSTPAVSSQRPSGTVLLESMARSLPSQALGVVLTGMGDDGAAGLKAIRDAGGYTIAEAESTAAVYGMPAAAVRLGGACESLPLPAIAPRLKQLVLAPQEAL